MRSRYVAQSRMAQIGNEGQLALWNASVLIIGCGALGSPCAMYLAGAGIGNLILADFDTIDLSNLHRQVFYSEKEVGESKVKILKKKLLSLNSEINVESRNGFISRIEDLERYNFDLIIDAADNPSTTYMIDKFCLLHNTPYVSAGVRGWEAQIFTFIPGSFSYGDVFPRPESDGTFMPCSIEGIIGPTAALASSLQASQAIKIVLGLAAKESQLQTVNLLTDSWTKLC